MARIRFSAVLLSGTIISGTFGSAMAADVMTDSRLPAVSAVNGKVSLGGGYADVDLDNGDGTFYGAASLSLPLGETFGFQGDLTVNNMFGDTGVGGVGHLFTRDPNSYLLGGIAGYTDFSGSSLAFAGAEGELYLDNISLEMIGGYMNVNPDFGSSSDKGFVMGDIAFYATENLRLTLGAASVGGFESAHAAVEWMMADMPLALEGDVRVGEDDYVAATLGVNYYFGGNEPGKSLLRRHREDDPRNRALDIFGAGAGAMAGGGGAAPLCTAPYVELDGYCVYQDF